MTREHPHRSSPPRGRFHSPLHQRIESILTTAYVGDWPARAWAAVPGATRVDVVRHSLALLPPRNDGGAPRAPLRLAFASDLHLGPTTSRRTLDRAFADLWTHHDRIEAAPARVGVRVLINEAVRLPAPWSDVAILGLDEPWTGRPDPDAAVAACGDATVKLAFAHAPEALPMLRGRGASLMLCGHTHGGHLALSGGKPLVIWAPTAVVPARSPSRRRPAPLRLARRGRCRDPDAHVGPPRRRLVRPHRSALTERHYRAPSACRTRSWISATGGAPWASSASWNF